MRCAGEVSDGVFPIWMNPEKFNLIGDHVEEGFAKAGQNKGYEHFDVAPFVPVAMGDNVEFLYPDDETNDGAIHRGDGS